MNISKFKNSKKFYIDSITTGKENKNEVNITFQNEDGNRIMINNMVPAFLKVSDKDSIAKEIIMSDIAFLLDIEVSMVYKVTNDRDEEAIISKSVCNQQELLISMDYVFKKLYQKYSSGISASSNWMTRALQIPESTEENPLTAENDLKELIDMGINSAYEAFNIQDKRPNEFKNKYLSMVLFDYITNQKTRNANDYSIIVNKDTKLSRLSPLYSIGNIAEDEIKTISFNNRIVERNSLINVLYKYYYPYIKELSQCISLHNETYLKSIKLICDFNAKSELADKILTQIKKNIDYIQKLDAQYSGAIKETKIDYTQTTIRINQTVMKKNLLIQNKYPEKLLQSRCLEVNPVIEEEKETGVKISCEKPIKQSGFSNVFLITSAIAFVCGLGVGIAYFLIMFNK